MTDNITSAKEAVAFAYNFREQQWMAYACIDKSSIITVWREYWWSFLQWLAQALASADTENEKKIRVHFSNYIQDYLKVIIKVEKKAIEDL